MATVAKSLRIEASLAARVKAIKREGEAESKAYMRVIAAGCEAIESGVEPDMGKAEQQAEEATASKELLDLYRQTVTDLKGQIDTKDKQISDQATQITELTNAIKTAQEVSKADKVLQAEERGLLVENGEIKAGLATTKKKSHWWSKYF